MNEPSWIIVARRLLGTTEIPGARHNQTIIGWLDNLKAWWRDDETPWCGVFVAECMRQAGYSPPKHWMRARAWADWGIPIPAPAYGCVAVFARTGGGGHVGFVVGVDTAGRLMVLGGNQGNKVSIAPFNTDRVIAYRMPGVGRPAVKMPIYAEAGKSSENEA